ncbi:WAT1-related protein [Abeliophyllum distichum]|uniref:WAT1-related protein n=1 Tax=Abeliophyllum distichum TaxID=126358 RepID=A0ABD1TH77_9LAMI
MSRYVRICNALHGLKPTLLMIVAQTIIAGINIVYKLATNDGMNLQVLVGYRFLFGAAFIVPIAFFAERKKRPKLTWMVLFQAFLCGIFGGALGQNLYVKSLALTSATFASATTNLIPAITFIVAVCLRLEKLGWHTKAGKAKVFGTILGIGGAMLLTFYKGPDINFWKTHINLLQTTTSHPKTEQTQSSRSGGHFLLGSLLALASCVCYSLWLIIQAKAAQRYPCPYSFTALMTILAAVQGVGYALCTERDWSQWKLGWNIRLLAVLFAGVFGSGVMFTLVAWCVRMRGPLFVSIFNPLMLLLVAIVGSLLLNEDLHLGTVLGAILIVFGLYIVLWGKGRELKRVLQLMPEKSSEDQDRQVEINISSSTPDNGSNHGSRCSGSGGKEISEEKEEEEEDRGHSRASSDVLGGLYMYP